MTHASIIIQYHKINMLVLHTLVTATNIFPCLLKNSKQRSEFNSMKFSTMKFLQKHHDRLCDVKFRAESMLETSWGY